MTNHIKHLFLVPAVIAVINSIPAGRVTAQTFTSLYGFEGLANGGYPNGLIVSSNTVYGTASFGSGGSGTVFAMNTDGTGFTNLHSFTPSYTPIFYIPATNSDGVEPKGLIVSGNTLYGAAGSGGSGGSGTVFAMNTDGTGFTNLYTFTFTFAGFDFINSDGDGLNGLILSGHTLYGTANRGGSSGKGTVFAVNTDGSGFTNLHSFAATPPFPGPYTNSEGANPRAGLILSGNILYGTAQQGGSSGSGTVFAINTDGTGFTNLHSFTAFSGAYPYTNSDGYGPVAGLVLSGSTLFGTAYYGGSSGYGTVFAVNTNGTEFRSLHNFTALDQSVSTNSDGANPEAGLILSGNTLYGTTVLGGSSAYGTVFAVNTDGTGFTTLHNFIRSGDGANPEAGLVLSGNTLYGAAGPDSLHYGTVFSLSFRPQLTLIPYRPYAILTWPTNVAGFDYTGYTLQSTTNLVSPVVWATNSPAPVVIGGQNVIINPITGAQQFFRLKQ